MAVKLRLTRMGAKKSPFYRIVAIDSRKARDGQYIEQIGYYNPTTAPATIKIDEEIAKKWLKVGAEMTDTVRDLFYKANLIEATKKLQNKGKKAEATDVVSDAIDAAVAANKTQE